MSVFRTAIFLTVLVLHDGHSWPTKLQQRDLMLIENAESIKGNSRRDKRDFNPIVEKELEALLQQKTVNRRSHLEDELNKLLNPAKRENTKINEKSDGDDKRTLEQLRTLQKEHETHPLRNDKSEEKELDEFSKLLIKKKVQEHPPPEKEEKRADHEEIRSEEENSQGNHAKELREDHPKEQELRALQSSREESHEDRPPIRKKSKEDYQKPDYKEVLRELHPPEEDEEEEREVHTSVQHDKKEQEKSHENHQRTSDKKDDDADDHENTLRESHPHEEDEQSEREIHPPDHHEKKEEQEISALNEEEHVRNTVKKKKEHSSLFTGHKQLNVDDTKRHKQNHIQLISPKEDAKTRKREAREFIKDDFLQSKVAKRNAHSAIDEDQDGNMWDTTMTNREQHKRYWTLLEGEEDSEEHKNKKELLPEYMEKKAQLDNRPPFYDEKGEKVNEDRSLDDEGLQDFNSRAEESDLHPPAFERQEDREQERENIMEDEEPEEAERTYSIPQEEQEDESINEKDNIVPFEHEPNTVYQDEYDDSEEEYQKKKRLLANLELMSLMAGNKDVPSELTDRESFLDEDTNDGTNIKKISPPLQIQKRFKDISMPKRIPGIEPPGEPMQPINEDEVHAFEDEEDGNLSQRDKITQNAFKMERIKALCRSCCYVERCWMIEGIHCDC